MDSNTDAKLVGNNNNRIATKDETKIKDNDLLFAIGGALLGTILVAIAIVAIIFIIFKRERKARILRYAANATDPANELPKRTFTGKKENTFSKKDTKQKFSTNKVSMPK
ncbi:Hypothetical protein SRAE_1000097300 [Strongyloides ratti]|uniref:Uncharacterized protein n=1 Tax=Strongyloides ratti TaxID=34506 RepID=A0A090MV77_STRRB|nr:Hypothetical protein SRAE_1000097300 [Strongyloides ratti]CEF62703.1 Hypothetical protein SRAE_1000097300 [Strongyloides ratti]